MLKRVAVLVVEALLVAAIIRYLFQHRGELGRVWSLRAIDVFLFGLVLAAEMLVRAVEFQKAVLLLGARITVTESLSLSYATSLLNYAPMNAGTLLRARALKRARSLSYAHYAALMSGLILLSVIGGAAMGLLVVLFAGHAAADNLLFLVALFAAAFASSLALLHMPQSWSDNRRGWFWGAFRSFLHGWRQLRQDMRAFSMLLGLAIAKLLLLSARFWICFGALQLPVDYLGSILFAVVTNMLVVVSITPGAVGVRELLIGALASVTGMSFAHGVAAASLDRVLSLVFVVAGGVPSLLHLRTRKLI